MGRQPRKLSSTGLYHVIIRGNNKQKLFHSPKDFNQYLKLIENYLQKYAVQIHHFCLMTNHVHLLTRVEAFKDLSTFMHGIQRGYHHYYRKTYTLFGHLFQGRFKSLPIEEEGYLLECGRYIERNPVRANLVDGPEAWPYSSYQNYVRGFGVKWITYSVAYLALSDSPEQRKQLYRARVEQSRPYEEIVDEALIGS